MPGNIFYIKNNFFCIMELEYRLDGINMETDAEGKPYRYIAVAEDEVVQFYIGKGETHTDVIREHGLNVNLRTRQIVGAGSFSIHQGCLRIGGHSSAYGRLPEGPTRELASLLQTHLGPQVIREITVQLQRGFPHEFWKYWSATAHEFKE